jgi:hypothetical protein
VTQGVQCWQRPGYKHNLWHTDPSQTIRLMWKRGELSDDEGESWEDVELADIAADPELASLLTHDNKTLSYLRQKGVEEQPSGGHIVLPPVAITIVTNGALEPEDDSDPKAGAIS